MNETDLKKLQKLQDNFEKWKRYNDKLENMSLKDPGYFLKSITLKLDVPPNTIEFDSINDMHPIYKKIIFEKIAEAVKKRYEEVKKEYESIQIITSI